MNVSKEKKVAEAVNRMNILGVFPETIKQFENEGLVSESEPPLGACFWLNDEQKKRVEEFEKKYDALVYHVIRSFTEFGELESYMYVSDEEEEWEMDNEDIKDGLVFAYVNNLDDPMCSEFGTIGVKLTAAAGLARVY